MPRFVTLALSMSLVLGLFGAARLVAQDEKKPESKESAKPETAKTPADEKAKDSAKEAEKTESKKPPEVSNQDLSVQGDIPPEVAEKLEAARKAVAEAIVAAEDANLVDSTVSPPPILDILILGRANDKAALKGASKETPEVGVSLEVFGAWYTGYGQMEGVTAEKNVRIVPPSKGLKTYFDTRSAVMTRYIQDARQAKAASAPKDEDKPKEEPKADTAPAPKEKSKTKKAKPKKDAKAKAEEPKADEPKEEAAPDEPKADDNSSEDKSNNESKSDESE